MYKYSGCLNVATYEGVLGLVRFSIVIFVNTLKLYLNCYEITPPSKVPINLLKMKAVIECETLNVT